MVKIQHFKCASKEGCISVLSFERRIAKLKHCVLCVGILDLVKKIKKMWP